MTGKQAMDRIKKQLAKVKTTRRRKEYSTNAHKREREKLIKLVGNFPKKERYLYQEKLDKVIMQS